MKKLNNIGTLWSESSLIFIRDSRGYEGFKLFLVQDESSTYGNRFVMKDLVLKMNFDFFGVFQEKKLSFSRNFDEKGLFTNDILQHLYGEV
jgi:hypothetical protein